MRTTTRREILKASGTVAIIAGVKSLPVASCASTSSSDQNVRLAIIGVGTRGKQHIEDFSACQGVKLVAFCDVDQDRVSQVADEFEAKSGSRVQQYNNYKKMLESDEIDAVTIATPNHWHSLMAIDAMKAGKHVYVEKPVCHTVWEGRQMVEAARQHDVICAAGFQNRSVKGVIEAMSIIHSRKFGAIKKVRGLCYRNRNGIGKSDQPVTPPASVNYDLWLGPAEDQPILRPNFHYDWHWDFNTGNGDMGNQGPHEMDLVRYALGDPLRHPQKVQSFGGRFAWDDAGNTPNMQCAIFDYGDGIPVIFEVRNLYQKEADKKHVGAFAEQTQPNIIVTMEEGEFIGGRFSGAFTNKQGEIVHRVEGGDDHYQNFIDAVRQNDQTLVRSTLESAFYSSCMSHLANISLLVGREVTSEELATRIQDNPLASECFDRFNQQLQLWEVDFEKTPWQLGSDLTFDSATEQFTAGENLAEANSLLRRQDRKPYVVPEYQSDKSNTTTNDAFTSLFDGRTLDGWQVLPAEKSDAWKVEDGQIVCENPDKIGSDLWTTRKYRDYQLKLEYIALTDYYDSGVFVRGDGHQVQIGISGSLNIDLTACIYAPADKKGKYPAQSDKVAAFNKVGQWNHLRVIVTGKRIQTFLNGEPIVDYEGIAVNDEGPIGLQLHPFQHMKLAFRNIKLKVL